MLKVTINDVGGKVVKKDARYTVTDNTSLKNLVVSSTTLKANRSTNGHKHEGQEEVYMFIKGNGWMTLDDDRFLVKEGEMVLIEDGVFHKIEAGPGGVYFVCVFDGTRSTEDAIKMKEEADKIVDMYTTKGI
jgi:quercetin dioxygenase-like cupin family protein|tara:strand:- start:432 stop:827 length:396 start_codon:yes stop_codon:yes gene_type:complete